MFKKVIEIVLTELPLENFRARSLAMKAQDTHFQTEEKMILVALGSCCEVDLGGKYRTMILFPQLYRLQILPNFQTRGLRFARCC